MNNQKKLLKIGLIVLLFLIFIGYTYYQAKNLIDGPIITVENPKDGSSSTQSPITIKGIAKNTSFIFIDDRPIYIDEQGNFSERILLLKGYNVIEIKARDKFGKEKKEVLEVVYK